jgi:DNA-damage-inducible protein J
MTYRKGLLAMPTTSITFRADNELKRCFEAIASDMGLPVTGLLNAFMKATVREGKLPFELMSDECAQRKLIRTKLEEAQTQANNTDTKWLGQDDVFAKFREKHRYEV